MAVPPKPKRMSGKRYRELYDTTPHTAELSENGHPVARYRCCGEVSAQVVASSWRKKGIPDSDIKVYPTEKP